MNSEKSLAEFLFMKGRVELRNMLVLYFLTLPFQLMANGSLLIQGSTGLVVLSE